MEGLFPERRPASVQVLAQQASRTAAGVWLPMLGFRGKEHEEAGLSCQAGTCQSPRRPSGWPDRAGRGRTGEQGGRGAALGVPEEEDYKKLRRGLVHVKPIWVCSLAGTLIKVRSSSPRDWETGPISRAFLGWALEGGLGPS